MNARALQKGWKTYYERSLELISFMHALVHFYQLQIKYEKPLWTILHEYQLLCPSKYVPSFPTELTATETLKTGPDLFGSRVQAQMYVMFK